MPVKGGPMKCFFLTWRVLFFSILFLFLLTTQAHETFVPLKPLEVLPTLGAELPKFPTKVRPKDPRYFGTFCDAEPIKRCKALLGLPFGLDEVCVTLKNVRASIDYVDTNTGRLVGGGGPLTVDDNNTTFVMAGVVDAFGTIQSSGRSMGYGEYTGPVQISSDGMEATINIKNNEIPLRKDACGNRVPSLNITSPTNGIVLTYGEYFPFTARVADEDKTFPTARAFFESDKDGVLTGYSFENPHPSDFEITLYNNNLSPGKHQITFTAIDSGGLSMSKTLEVSVTDDPPDRPDVMFKGNGREPVRVTARGAVLIEGKAFDQQEGFLNGESLIWRASINGSDPVIIGKGKRLITQFKEPGEAIITLTAVDRTGLETTSERHLITVDPFNGNTHPRVAIAMPNQSSSRGPLAASLYAGDVAFRGIAEDTEDRTSDLKLRWHFEAIRPAGVVSPADQNGTAAAKVSFTPDVDTIYRVTFSATDSGKLVGEATINLLIIAQPID